MGVFTRTYADPKIPFAQNARFYAFLRTRIYRPNMPFRNHAKISGATSSSLISGPNIRGPERPTQRFLLLAKDSFCRTFLLKCRPSRPHTVGNLLQTALENGRCLSVITRQKRFFNTRRSLVDQTFVAQRGPRKDSFCRPKIPFLRCYADEYESFRKTFRDLGFRVG